MSLPPTSRRDFLRRAGSLALLSPLVPLLSAHAAEAATPRRLVLFFTPHATYWPGWTPSGSQSDFTLGPVLAPLAPYQSTLNLLRGVYMRTGQDFVAHTPGGVQLWTGSELARGAANGDGTYQYGKNTGPSVDQVVAQRIGGATAYPSLQFSVRTGQTVIYGGPGQPIYGATDPAQAFGRLFSNTSTETIARRGSVLDVVTQELRGLQGQLAQSDKSKLEAHLASVRGLEKRLQVQQNACAGPTLAPAADDAQTLAAHMDLATSAMACDLTRVVSFQFGQPDNDGDSYPFLGISAGHHPMTHLGASDTVDPDGNPASTSARSVNGQIQAVYTWYSTMVAGLLGRLQAVPEGGGTMLDNTLVVWGSELADFYTHTFSPSIPFVTAGGGGMGLATGRNLDFRRSPQVHNRLLVSICQLMGLGDVTTFGNMDVGAGPLLNF